MEKDNYEIPLRCHGIAVVLLKKSYNKCRVLLMKRATPVLKDIWCYIGGGIEQGEKAWEAALREIREETGITKVALYTSNRFDQFYSPAENNIYIAPVFVGYVGEEEVILNYEHKEFMWVTFKEAKKIVSLPGNADVLWYIEKYFVKKHPMNELKICQN